MREEPPKKAMKPTRLSARTDAGSASQLVTGVRQTRKRA
jgi:hypothetical protein